MAVTCEIEGISQLLSKFNELAINSLNSQKAGLNTAGEKLVTQVKETKKFDDESGDLRKSIKKSNVKSNKYGKYVWVGDVDAKTNYSWFVEYGRNGKTGYVAPTHFLKGTMLENSKELTGIMIHELRKGLKL